MDGKGHKKIRKYFGIYAIFALVFSVLMYLLSCYESYVKQQQIVTLLTAHPELESEIIALWERPQDSFREGEGAADELAEVIRITEEKYGYQWNPMAMSKPILFFWMMGMLSGAFLTALLGFLEWRKVQASKADLRELHECLDQFREGDFLSVPDYEGSFEEWGKLWESVRELGIYFEGLKLRLTEEEDSTKALITDISHQLKTPLASLKMSYELAVGSSLTEEERTEFQRQEAKEIEKLELLLSELVNLSRLETRMIQIRTSPASLKKTITEAVSQIYIKAKGKDISIRVEMDGDVTIRHDAEWTAEALANVLDNAVKYSTEHTMITVRVQSLIRNVLIEIEDEGIGILPGELAKIYQRFYRGKEAREKVKEGAGVGLYLARMILERQGGTISAKRKMEKGTVFQITLPA